MAVAQEFVSKLAQSCHRTSDLAVVNMEDIDPGSWEGLLAGRSAVLVCSSTAGMGSPPQSAKGFLKWLTASDEARPVMQSRSPCFSLGRTRGASDKS